MHHIAAAVQDKVYIWKLRDGDVKGQLEKKDVKKDCKPVTITNQDPKVLRPPLPRVGRRQNSSAPVGNLRTLAVSGLSPLCVPLMLASALPQEKAWRVSWNVTGTTLASSGACVRRVASARVCGEQGTCTSSVFL